MRRGILVALAGLVLGGPLLAQQGVKQGGISVPAYPDQQRWGRASFLLVSTHVAGIAAAKARGQTAEEYGRFVGDLFAPGWGAPNTGSAIRVARGWLNNAMASTGSEAAITSASDTAATVRYRRVHVAVFGAQRVSYGVTLDEYDRSFAAFAERIGAHLGVRIQPRIDGDWDEVNITGRGSSNVFQFPLTTYRAAFTAQDVAAVSQLAGEWESTYAAGGRFTVRRNGEVLIEGNYDVLLDQITFRNERGATACPDNGTYIWNVNAANGNLRLVRLSDSCEARFHYLTRRAFPRKQ
jgi:hypothetical protein